MSPAKVTKRRKAPARKRRRTVRGKIIVRMYDVGFGDAFLVFIPTSAGVKKVLIDCGSIKLTDQKPIKSIVKQIIHDVTDHGKARIDLVIGTHRHKDHVSGFSDDAWDDVEVGEVWMPWTEDPDDPEARRIRETQAGIAAHLQATFDRLGAAAPEEFSLIALNALSNESAMTTLHDGFRNRARRRFLPGRNGTDQRIESDILPGVIVHVLGPSHDESVIRDMEPPAGKSYLRLMSGADPGVPNVPQPFEDWIFADADYKKSYPHLALATPYQKQLQDIGDDFAQAVAVSLDKAVNGTSLMLVFKIGRVHLLFPGDAQWGTWRSALDHAESRALLRKAEFYKVGHHGSHNATPIEFVEKVFHKDSWTMTSVRPVAKWKSIPRKPLLEALGKKTKRLVRSDRADAAARAGFRVAPLYVEATIPLR